MTTQSTTGQPPYRVVDSQGVGWHASGDLYFAPGEYGGITYDELRNRGPLRPVMGMPAEDEPVLRAALVGAGVRMMATVMVALAAAGEACSSEYGTTYAITAGRPGSWEATCVREMMFAGGDLDPTPDRVDPAALAVLTEVLTRWTCGRRGVVEVSENLNGIVADAINEVGGWTHAADPTLRRDGVGGSALHWVNHMLEKPYQY